MYAFNYAGSNKRYEFPADDVEHAVRRVFATWRKQSAWSAGYWSAILSQDGKPIGNIGFPHFQSSDAPTYTPLSH